MGQVSSNDKRSSHVDGPSNGRTVVSLLGPVITRLAVNEPLFMSDPLWLQLLEMEYPWKVDSPESFDDIVRQHLSAPLLATNEFSGNIPALFKFTSKALRAYRQAIRANVPLPCTAASLAALSEVIRVLLRHLVESLTAPDLLFHFEFTPRATRQVEEENKSSRPQDGDLTTPISQTCLRIVYRNNAYLDVEVSGKKLSSIRESIVHWFCSEFPDDMWIITHHGFVFRHPDDGICVFGQLPQLLQQPNFKVSRCLTIIPLALPQGPPQKIHQMDSNEKSEREQRREASGSTLREFYYEVVTFFVGTQMDITHRGREAVEADRLLSVTQRHLLECLTILFSVFCPAGYGESSVHLRKTDWEEDKEEIQTTGGPYKEGDQLNSSSEWRMQEKVLRDASALTSFFSQHSLPPPADDREAHSVPHLFLYLQALQPFPNVFSPTVDYFSLHPFPYCIFLDAFIETFVSDYSWRRNHLKLSEQELEDSEKSISYEFLISLLTVVWMKGPRIEEDSTSVLDILEQHDLSTIPLALSLSCLSLCVLLVFHIPKVWELTDLNNHPSLGSYAPPAYLWDVHTLFGPNSSLLTQQREEPPRTRMINIFSEFFCRLNDPKYFSGSKEELNSTLGSRTFDLSALLSTLASPRLDEHLCPVLLYVLLSRNPAFRLFCLTRSDLDVLILPLLKVLHKIPAMCTFIPQEENGVCSTQQDSTVNSDPKASYPAPPASTLLLLSLLILSEDPQFCKTLHTVELSPKQIAFMSQPKLTGVNLGSLTILVLLRLISWNFGHARDLYLHQICAGVLINIAPTLTHPHWFVAEKLVDYFLLLCRQLAKRLPNALSLEQIESLFECKPLESLCSAIDEKNVSQLDDYSEEKMEEEEETGVESYPATLSPQLQSIGIILQSLSVFLCCSITPPQLQKNWKLLYFIVRGLEDSCLGALRNSLHQHEEVLPCLEERLLQFEQVSATIQTRYAASAPPGSSFSSGVQYSCVPSQPPSSSCLSTPTPSQEINGTDCMKAASAWKYVERKRRNQTTRQCRWIPNIEVPRALACLSRSLCPYFQFLQDIIHFFGATVDEEATVEENLEKLAVTARKLPAPSGQPQGMHCVDDTCYQRLRTSQLMTREPQVKWSYTETTTAHHYFLPLIWKTLFLLHPNYACWVRQPL